MRLIHNKNEILLLGENGETLANVTFPEISENVVDVNHTFVHASQRGKGLAQKLMKKLVEDLELTNRKAILTCSYAKKWFHENPQYDGLIVSKISE